MRIKNGRRVTPSFETLQPQEPEENPFSKFRRSVEQLRERIRELKGVSSVRHAVVIHKKEMVDLIEAETKHNTIKWYGIVIDGDWEQEDAIVDNFKLAIETQG